MVNGSEHVTILPGNGDGTFAARASYPTGEQPTGVVVASLDPDSDASPDVLPITASWASGGMIVEGANTRRGATLAPGQHRQVAAAIDATHASDEIEGEAFVEYDPFGWAYAGLHGITQLGPGHSAVSPSNKPETCSTAYSLCELLLWVADERRQGRARAATRPQRAGRAPLRRRSPRSPAHSYQQPSAHGPRG